MLQDVVNMLALAGIYLLFALGMSLAWGTIGILNFAHGSIFMFAAFIDYLIVRDVRLPFLALVVIGIGGRRDPVGRAPRSLRSNRSCAEPRTPMPPTCRSSSAASESPAFPLAIAQKVTKSNPFGFVDSSFKIHTYDWTSGLRISNTQIFIIVCGVVLGGGTALWLRKSRSGLALRSIGVDAETASMMGINRRALAIATHGPGRRAGRSGRSAAHLQPQRHRAGDAATRCC